jgi:hypothetical protein
LGIVVGYKLSTLPKLQPSKLLNLAGLSYNFLAVVVLSELVAPNPKWNKLCVDTIAPLILWLGTLVPLGVFLGGYVAQVILKTSSGIAVSQFATLFWGYSLIPLAVLNETVTFPQFAALKALDSRWRWFGLYLLLSGVGFQLIAALLGLRS